MPSPFPGMDPYLEDPAFWRDFHGEFTYAVRHLLLKRLPAEYDAAAEEDVRLLEVPPEDEAGAERGAGRDVVPDVLVTAQRQVAPQGAGGVSAAEGGVATLDPVTIEVPVRHEVRQRWIRILHRPDDSLVTAIGVLSPSSKNGDGVGEYRAKRDALLRQRVNLVELDLLVRGRRLKPRERVPAGDYYALVSRATRPGERDVYAWGVRRPLPTIPVPLREPVGDVPLDLAASLTLAYDRGDFGRRLRYGQPLAAPLREDVRAWAAGFRRLTEAP